MIRTVCGLAVAICLWATAGSAQAPGSRLTAMLGEWSASLGGTQWDLLFEPNRQYSIWRISIDGDTLVLSMGVWSLEDGTFCIQPPGRSPICGPYRITRPDDPSVTRWDFLDRSSGFGWEAYRRGYAPWDRASPGRSTDVYQLDDVAIKPQLIGCAQPLTRLPEMQLPIQVFARLIVEPDSSVSNIEIMNAPSERLRRTAERAAQSCRITPGRLRSGMVVRVRVELPLLFP